MACTVTTPVFLALAGVSDAVYARDFRPVVLELEAQETFLERTAPDYRTVEFINRTLSPETSRSAAEAERCSSAIFAMSAFRLSMALRNIRG
jgi:hypothetical protein